MKKVLALVMVLALALSVFTGCGDNKTQNENVSIRWYVPAGPGASDAATQEISNYLKEKLNVTMDFVKIEFSDYDQKMQVLNAGNDEYDIAFTSSWCNNYNKNISNGTIIELDDLIKEYAPETYALMEPEIWDLARVDGKLYGIINQQIMGRAPFMTIPAITMETLGLSKDEFKTWKDSEKYFRAIKEKTGNYTYVSEIWPTWVSAFGFEEVLGQKVPGAIYISDDKDSVKIVNQYETEEFKEYIKWRRQLVLDGLTPPNIVKVDNEDAALKSGDSKIVNVMHFQPAHKPGIDAEYRELPNGLGTLTTMAIQEAYMSTYAVTSTLNSISATSKNPEAAMKVLNLINTDPILCNYITHGVEGTDYKKTGDTTVEKLPEGKYNGSNWALGNTFLAYTNQKQPVDMHEQTQKINSESRKSVLAGFVANIDPVKTQVYNCTAVVDEFLQPLDFGVVDIDETYPKFIEKLKAAGVDDVIAEINRQLDEWKK